MATATLSNASSTQLTFPWAMPQVEIESTIVTEVAKAEVAPAPVARIARQASEQRLASSEEVAPSLQAALVGDRIGKPFKVGSVMFRLLKSYGITDEEIAAGIASYQAKRAAIG